MIAPFPTPRDRGVVLANMLALVLMIAAIATELLSRAEASRERASILQTSFSPGYTLDIVSEFALSLVTQAGADGVPVDDRQSGADDTGLRAEWPAPFGLSPPPHPPVSEAPQHDLPLTQAALLTHKATALYTGKDQAGAIVVTDEGQRLVGQGDVLASGQSVVRTEAGGLWANWNGKDWLISLSNPADDSTTPTPGLRTR